MTQTEDLKVCCFSINKALQSILSNCSVISVPVVVFAILGIACRESNKWTGDKIVQAAALL